MAGKINGVWKMINSTAGPSDTGRISNPNARIACVNISVQQREQVFFISLPISLQRGSVRVAQILGG
ncbi:hypothetical protein Ato02nite_095940 [Paractinoplanes toevensis]|uniref:Uncharacterized protein n=1 Tax=Paractinoplanes toevensis TaxID=571911 RepID=A0A920BRN2_9ACTN|nr:hypothetical protein Ato02nite_095940 [Actinoplanes toevensis]